MSENEGGTGGTESTGASGTSSGNPLLGGAPSAGTSGSPSSGPASGRPDWIPEKFWDFEKAQPRVQDLAKSYQNLESLVGKKRDAYRDELLNEVRAEVRKGVPETADGYVTASVKVDVPEHVKVNLRDDDELIAWWKGTAHALGLPQSKFEEGIAAFVKAQAANFPDPKEELKKFGENGPQRIEALQLQLAKLLPTEEFNALSASLSRAESIRAVERIVSRLSGAGPASFEGTTTPMGGLTREHLENLMREPRYWRDHDPVIVKQVEEGFQRLAQQKKR